VAAESLVTGSGEKVWVIYPGKENRDSGPDFMGAVIATDGGLLIGDVELYQKAGDWKGHGHHLQRGDPSGGLGGGGIGSSTEWQDSAHAELVSLPRRLVGGSAPLGLPRYGA